MKNKIENKTLLITGGAGFLGSHLCEFYLNNNRVICVDSLASGRIENINHLLKNKNFVFMNHDVIESMPKILEDVDYVLHFASRAAPEEYQKHAMHTLKTNSIGTMNMLEFAWQKKAIFLFASTSEIYGQPSMVPTPETYYGYANTIGPRSCYDESKRFGETICKTYAESYNGLDVRIIRIFNTFGPRIRHDVHYGRALPRFIYQALTGKDITIYGDGSQTRSFMYVSDLVSAVNIILRQKGPKKVSHNGHVYNVGNPQEVSIKKLAEKIIEYTNSKSKITYSSLPKDDPLRRVPDITKMKSLGWEPKVHWEDGLKLTIKWFKEKMV